MTQNRSPAAKNEALTRAEDSAADRPLELDETPEIPPALIVVPRRSSRPPPDPALERRINQGQAVVRSEALRQRRRFGAFIELEEAEAQGRAALAEALRSYDPARGPFRPYVRQKAAWAILTGARRTARGHGAVERDRVLCARDSAVGAAEEVSGEQELLLAGGGEGGFAARVADDSKGRRVVLPVGWEEMGSSDVPSPEEELARAEVERLVADAIERLPKRQRVLVQRYLGDETITAIATDLGLSKSWVSRLLDQALTTLRRELGDLR